VLRVLVLSCFLGLTLCSMARAVTEAEIPDELRARLPEFVLQVVDPAALKALSLADLEEFATAYEEGNLRFVAEVRAWSTAGR